MITGAGQIVVQNNIEALIGILPDEESDCIDWENNEVISEGEEQLGFDDKTS